MKKYKISDIIKLSVLAALQVVLSRFVSINVGSSFKLSFGFVPVMLAGAMYGPLGGMLTAVISDIAGALLFPSGSFFIGYTVTAALSALVYGLLLPRKALKIWRIIIAYGVTAVAVTMGLNALCIAFQYGYLLTETHEIGNVLPKFIAMLPGRATQAAIMLPVQIAVSYFLLDVLHLPERLTLHKSI